MTDRTYTIGELCAEFAVTPRTLRFYEYKELLAPVREGQRRLFTQRDRARLKLILRGKNGRPVIGSPSPSGGIWVRWSLPGRAGPPFLPLAVIAVLRFTVPS